MSICDYLFLFTASFESPRQKGLELVHVNIEYRGYHKGQKLGEEQSADNRQTQRPAGFGTRTIAQCNGQRPHEGRHGGHHDGPKSDDAGLMDGFHRSFAFFPFRLQCEVDHNNAVFLDESYQHDNAHEGIDAEIDPEQKQCDQSAEPRKRQGRKYGD